MSGDSRGMFARRRERKEAAQSERAEQQRQEETGFLISQAKALTLEPDCDATFVAKRGEEGFFSLPAQLVEPRTTTYRGYASKRVNVGGFNFRVGGSAPVRRTEMTVIDVGTMIVTNQRVLFIGNRATREWLFSKVVGYDDSDPAALFINVSNRQKTSGVSYNPKWDGVVEAYFTSAVTKATDPEGWRDQIEQAIQPVASRLAELGVNVSLVSSSDEDEAGTELPPPPPGTAVS